MRKEIKKAPTIRFRGFTEDWEQRKFGDVFTERSEKKHESLPPLTIIQGGGTIRRDKMDRKLIYDKKSLTNYKLVKKNDFIVHLRSFEGGLEKSDIEGIVSPAYHIFYGKNVNPEFYYNFFRSSEFIKHKLVPFVYGIRDGRSIDIAGMKTIKIPSPSFEEQEQIGNYFHNLDNLITLHQRKFDELKTAKTYFLQNMFPAKGEKVPRIRFHGFTGDWEQRKLNELSDVRDGTHDSPKYINMGHPFITSKNVGSGFINYDNIQYISDEDYEKINKRSKVEIHDILMGMIGTIGNLALIRDEPDFAIKNVALIKNTGNVDYQFLYQELQTASIISQLSAEMDGGTQKFISLKKIRELNIIYPEKKEQQKIGFYFSNLDNLITLHQRKLDQLKTLKKFMLQNLFI